VSICASGSSTTKPGVNTSIVVDANFVRSILPAGLAWLYPYLPWMSALEIGDVPSFCAADPPTFTVPSAADIFSFITGGPLSEAIAVNDFMRDIARYYLWFNLCQCSSGTTPAPSSPPSAPSNLPVINPPAIVQPSATDPCAQFAGVLDPWVDPTGHHIVVIPQGTDSSTCPAVVLPVGATSLVITATSNVRGTVHGDMSWAYNLQSGPCTSVAGGTFTTHSGATLVTNVTIPSTAKQFWLWTPQNVATDDYGSATVSVFCGGNNGSQPTAPCCPPDPILTGYLKRILDMVTLVQRQGVPFGYVPGTTHSGVTGSGSISVSDLIGVKITITASNPGVLGTEAGDPERLWNAGRYNWGTADGWSSPQWLNSTETLAFPPFGGAYTLFGYSLTPGTVADILELKAEP
jgi:hypothetical protein